MFSCIGGVEEVGAKARWNKSRLLLTMVRHTLGSITKLKSTLKAREGLLDATQLTGPAAIVKEIFDFARLSGETYPENMFATLLEKQRDRATARLAALESTASFLGSIDRLTNFEDVKRKDIKLKEYEVAFSLFVKHVTSAFSKSSPSFYPSVKFCSHRPGHPLANTVCAGSSARESVWQSFVKVVKTLTQSPLLNVSAEANVYLINMLAFDADGHDVDHLAGIGLIDFLAPMVSFPGSTAALLEGDSVDDVAARELFKTCGTVEARNTPFAARLAAWRRQDDVIHINL